MRPRLFLEAVVISLVISVTAVSAQEAAFSSSSLLSNTGQPMRVAYACPEEELQFAGMSCSDDQPCTIYLELSAVAAMGGRILVAGDLHGTSATLASILLLSDDGGASWKETAGRIRGAALDQLEWLDAKSAWAGGEMQYPLARGAFFLMTADGGSSWHRQAVADDDSPGSLLRFWFDSAKHGEAIVDGGVAATGGRYLAYDSETGGESWSLAGQGASLPKLRHTPPGEENPEWRLAASKDGKAFEVEQRAKTVASFLIEAARCGSQPGETR